MDKLSGKTSEAGKAPEVQSIRLEPGDLLKHYQEGRNDVRAYAGFVIQVITLLLSTMIIVFGWVAKDYATEKYRVALQATAPALVATNTSPNGHLVPIGQMAPADTEKQIRAIERDLEHVSDVYRHMLFYSPTTSLLLDGAAFFTLVILGMLTVLTYQLQRRRYHYHPLGERLGLDLDQPVVDPVLTRGALNLFIFILGIIAVLLVVVAAVQSWAYGHYTQSVGLRWILLVLFVVVSLKAYSVYLLILNFSRFERKEGWKVRWRRARHLVAKIKDAAVGSAGADAHVWQALDDLKAICESEGKDRWRSAKQVLNELILSVKDTTLGTTVKEDTHELLVTLRYSGLRSGWK